MKAIRIGATAAWVALVAASAQGQQGSAPAAPLGNAAAPAGNAASAGNDLGARIASQGGGGAVVACAGCHGAKGEGNAAAHFPRLAAQSSYYMLRQLDAFADGTRKSQVMSPIAAAMSPEQRRAASDYYASLSGPAQSDVRKAAGMQRATALANVGDARLGVQACGNCHGPQGSGEPPTYPYLAGQMSAYIVGTMNDFRSGAVPVTRPARWLRSAGSSAIRMSMRWRNTSLPSRRPMRRRRDCSGRRHW